MKNPKKAFITNVALVILEVIAITWMMSGVKLYSNSDYLMAARLGMLKFFTVDSNILMGIVALIALIYEYKVLKGKIENIPNYVYVLKLIGTTSVTLTMMVTIFFLVPQSGIGVLIAESNSMLHVINPVVSIIALLLYEKNNINFKYTFMSIIPMALYAVYYVYGCLTHVVDGKVLPTYDWYGFFMLGPNSIYIVLPIVFVITYIFGLVLWKLSKEK